MHGWNSLLVRWKWLNGLRGLMDEVDESSKWIIGSKWMNELKCQNGSMDQNEWLKQMDAWIQ